MRRGVMTQAADSVVSVSVMADNEIGQKAQEKNVEFYCPRCQVGVDDPLVCGDCTSIICRRCGTPLEQVDELGIG